MVSVLKGETVNIENFGPRLRELRKKAGMSQRELAPLVGINFTYLSKIEGGDMPPPSEKVIEKLALVLHADRDELINLAGKIPSDLTQILKNRRTLEFLRSSDAHKYIQEWERKKK